MASLDQHITARTDTDLLARIVAAAEIQNIPNPQGWAEANVGKIVATTIDSSTTIADVHAYAVANYTPTPRPGANPAAVTDAQIIEAVQTAHGPTT